MAKPIILRTKAETEGTAKAFVSLAATVASSMGSVSSATLCSRINRRDPRSAASPARR